MTPTPCRDGRTGSGGVGTFGRVVAQADNGPRCAICGKRFVRGDAAIRFRDGSDWGQSVHESCWDAKSPPPQADDGPTSLLGIFLKNWREWRASKR